MPREPSSSIGPVSRKATGQAARHLAPLLLVAPAVAATGAPGQREAEGERRVVGGVSSSAECKVES